MKARKSLQTGINRIVLSVWLISITMQIFYILILYYRTTADARSAFNNSMVSAHGVLESRVDLGKKLTQTISGKSQSVVEYFTCGDQAQRRRIWQEIVQPQQNISAMAAVQFYVLTFDENRELIDYSAGTSPQLIKTAHQAYAEYLSDTPERENLVFQATADDPLASMSFFLFSDVSLPRVNRVGLRSLGTVAVACKVNRTEFIRQTGLNERDEIVVYRSDKDAPGITLNPGRNREKKRFTWSRRIADTYWTFQGGSTSDMAIPTGVLLLAVEALIMSVMFFLMQRFLRWNVFSPIQTISSFLTRYSITQRGERIHLQNETEIGLIAERINTMVCNTEQLSRRIMQTQQTLYESEIAQKDALLYALQAQLNPHFMYNTLDCICGIANASGVPQVADIAVALASMLRYGLSKEVEAPLSQEIAMVKNYLYIMEYRRPNEFDAEFHISPEANQVLCPKILLQPIVENTFKHGFGDRTEGARLSISAHVDEGTLTVTVYDNGAGIPREKLEEIHHDLAELDHTFFVPKNGTGHIGLLNIQNRLRLNYGGKYGLSLESEEGSFTRITIEIPT